MLSGENIMIKYEQEEEFIKFDYEIANNLIGIIQNRTMTKGTIEYLLRELDKFFKSKQEKFDITTLERKETEDEAIAVCGQDFVGKYREILNFFEDNNINLHIHGTNPKIVNEIMGSGLWYSAPDLMATTVSQDLNNPQFSNLLNWPHRQYKGLVLLGIPQDSNYQVWRRACTEKDKFDTGFYIDNSFVFGIMDMDNHKIELNPNFHLEHNYDDMIEDVVFANSLKYYKMYGSNNKEEFSTKNVVQAGEPSFHVDDEIQKLQEDAESNIFSFTEEMFNSVINLRCFAEGDKWFRKSEVANILEHVRIYAKVMFDNMYRLPEVIESASLGNFDENMECTFSDSDIEWY